eukprot:5601918-Prymnesium_polylepis.1
MAGWFGADCRLAAAAAATPLAQPAQYVRRQQTSLRGRCRDCLLAFAHRVHSQQEAHVAERGGPRL